MIIQRECLASFKEDIKPLLEKHWEEVALHQGKIKLNPDWQEYARLDAQGSLVAFTARKNGVLVGYCVLLKSRSMHYKDHIFASNDVVFVIPKYRNTSTGYKLIKAAQEYCKDAGVSLMTVNTKVHIPFDKLMLDMGFDLVERIYSILLRK
jgi:GNAT superfamily N-acetyltransferase